MHVLYLRLWFPHRSHMCAFQIQLCLFVQVCLGSPAWAYIWCACQSFGMNSSWIRRRAARVLHFGGVNILRSMKQCLVKFSNSSPSSNLCNSLEHYLMLVLPGGRSQQSLWIVEKMKIQKMPAEQSKKRFDKARGRSGFRRHFDGGGNKWCNDVQCKVRQVGNLCSKLHSEVSQGITTELF